MQGARLVPATAGTVAVLLATLISAPAQDKRSAPATADTKIPVAAGAWSGQSGSSRHPLMTADAIRAAAADFKTCIENQWPEAQRRGVSPETFDAATAKLAPDLQIMDLLDNQPEYEKPIWDYIDAIVTDERIAQGRALLDEHRDIFDAVENAYGVDRHVLAAIWGVETNYSKEMDSRLVVRSTATLACIGRRQGHFREEFLTALEILQHGDIAPERFTGNWAGAFDGTQFEPTTYRRFAVDFDKDGKRDLASSLPDLLASTANVLKYNGWTFGRRALVEVTLPENFNYLLTSGPRRTVRGWRELGVTLADGQPLTGDSETASVMLPTGAAGPAFLTLGNSRVLRTYNPTNAYVLTVAYLSNRLAGEGPFAKPWPRGERALSAAERYEIQWRLQQRGYFMAEEPTGRIELSTRRAIQQFQVSAGLTPDGFASAALLERLRAQ
jgi:membrane-bound lytic murein transglycosylase B